MSANLFGNRGGRRTLQVHVPSEAEGFALAVALAMHFTKTCEATHPMFYSGRMQAFGRI